MLRLTKKHISLSFTLILLACFIGMYFVYQQTIASYTQYVYQKITGKSYTVEERLTQYGPKVKQKLAPIFTQKGINYPPKHLAYVAFKDSKKLEVYAKNQSSQAWQYIMTYPIIKTSGVLGPKLKEGDKQVPEGIYKSNFLNANSRYHLSIRVNYPNQFDQQMAIKDNRTQLGGDIMIHGSNVSIGCLAMGDEVAERLFVLAAHSNQPIHIIISPTDFRINPQFKAHQSQPSWTPELYNHLKKELNLFSQQNQTKTQHNQTTPIIHKKTQ